MLVMMAIIPIYVGSAMSVSHMAHPDKAKSEVCTRYLSRGPSPTVDPPQLMLTCCCDGDDLIQMLMTWKFVRAH